MAVLGLRFCVRAFSSCGERGPLFIVVRGPLIIAASLVAEHRLQTCRLSSCGSRAQLLHGMCDLPRPGLEPVTPALAGRFSTTAPPGKPHSFSRLNNIALYGSTTFCLSIHQLMDRAWLLRSETKWRRWSSNTIFFFFQTEIFVLLIAFWHFSKYVPKYWFSHLHWSCHRKLCSGVCFRWLLGVV